MRSENVGQAVYFLHLFSRQLLIKELAARKRRDVGNRPVLLFPAGCYYSRQGKDL